MKSKDPQQDIISYINKKQAEQIARYIGIDYEEMKKFSDFFDQVAKMQLPKGYRRKMRYDNGNVVYCNEQTGQQDTMHPSMAIIKANFYRMLSDASKVYTFRVKSNTLLPFIQQKLAKQCMGLNIKRRDIEKINIKKDETSKIAINKLVKIKPDLKKLINSRNYMLKGLVEKVYTKKQLWGRGKKINAFTAILAQDKLEKNTNQGVNDEEGSQQTLELYEKIFMESKNFYDRKYGNLLSIPQQLKMSQQYLGSSPSSVVRYLNILNIERNNLQLYWLARLMQCLPLAPNWSHESGIFDKYLYQPKKLYFDIHPSYIYILQQIAWFKQMYSEMEVNEKNYYQNMKEMVFFDLLNRPYHVDLYAFISINSDKIVNDGDLDNDWMVLQGIKNTELNIQNYVLVQQILQYWKTLKIEDNDYIPTISPFGQIIWSSAINQKMSNGCPHQQMLNAVLQKQIGELPTIRGKDLKQMCCNEENRFQQIFLSLSQQRQNFLQHYLFQCTNSLPAPYHLPEQYTKQQYFDEVFISEFNLESGLTLADDFGEMPAWLEKMHAKSTVFIMKEIGRCIR